MTGRMAQGKGCVARDEKKMADCLHIYAFGFWNAPDGAGGAG